MLCVRVVRSVGIAVIGAGLVVCPMAAAEHHDAGELGVMLVPGGLRAATAVLGDPAGVDRAQFLLEFISRSYNAPAPEVERSRDVRVLLDHLASQVGAGDTVPLPLPPGVWSEAVFRRPVAERDLLSAILRSRDAALLYYGLLSVDDATRAWLAEHPGIVRDALLPHAAAFVLAAPALRVANGSMQVPGGSLAEPSWESLIGPRVSDPAAFVPALLAADEGRLAYFYGALGPLTREQVAFALRLDAGPQDRTDAVRQLFVVFRRAATGWNILARPFRRPAIDPALLVADLRVDDRGRPLLPGTREFWTAVFAGTPKAAERLEPGAVTGAHPVNFAWLCERVVRVEPRTRPTRYHAVLFASRLSAALGASEPRDAADAVRAAAAYPALAAGLERARVADPGVFARAARRADALSRIRSDDRSTRALAQFQGAMALLIRAATRGSLPHAAVASLVSSLSAVEHTPRGDYEGRLLRWLAEHLGTSDEDLVILLAGSPPAGARVVEWEGTRYALDLAHAESLRLSRLMGDDRRPYVASAVAVLSLADALDGPRPPAEQVREAASRFAAVADAVEWDHPQRWGPDVSRRYRRAADALARHSSGAAGRIGSVASLLRELADDLLARGLLVLVHATALGQPERQWVAADDIARRHAFRIRESVGGVKPWDVPATATGAASPHSTVGSLLGLDVAYADLSLVRLSARPPSRVPMIGAANRRGFVEALALVDTALLRDEDARAIADALRAGRERLRAVGTAADARALAHLLRLSAARASLLPWVVSHDPGRIPAFLSTGELLLLGLGAVSDTGALQPWGASAVSRLGCLCLRLPHGAPWETVAGRVGSGMLVSVFPDLHLRLAELLATMQMPASLLGPVLASATHDFVTTAISRGEDDRRGMLEFVQALGIEQLELYLGPLTSDGPLVPVDASAAPDDRYGGQQ